MLQKLCPSLDSDKTEYRASNFFLEIPISVKLLEDVGLAGIWGVGSALFLTNH